MPRISSPVKPKAAKRLSMEDKAPKSPTRSGSSGRKVATPSKKAPSTPTRKKTPKTPVVTPTTPRYRKKPAAEEDFSSDSDSENVSDASNNPQRLSKKFLNDIPDPEDIEKSVKELKDTAIPLNATKKAYSIVHKFTGSLGGNGAGGPIYGELTIKSMQKVVEMMRQYMEFDSSSRFIDVGAGLGKPNMHVAMDPKVEFSYGIEVNPERWYLSLSNLKPLLKASLDDEEMGKNVILEKGDIFDAKAFDPFTHVYMFDIGFPGKLFSHLSEMFNKSTVSKYLISYYGPKKIIGKYGFDVELMFKLPVSMHGSGEGHTGYYYRRVAKKEGKKTSKAKKALNLVESDDTLPLDVPCDDLFKEAWRKVIAGPEATLKWTTETLSEFEDSQRPSRERVQRIPYNM